MNKIVVLFPGQGAQYRGMGREFYNSFPESRKAFEEASKLLCLDMETLCFEENDLLNQTQYTQAAIVTVCAAIFIPLKGVLRKPFAFAGLSLGEYAALYGAGVLSFSDAVWAVRKRGIFMEEAYPSGGAMAAVLGLTGEAVEQICAGTEGQVWVANYNCPGQLVITGAKEAVEQAAWALKEAGAKRVLPLKVSGPFHSPLLKEAGRRLRPVLEGLAVHKPEIPYVANVTADYVKEKESILSLLERQVFSPVRFEQSIRKLISDGADTFVEVGPGHTLSSFVRKIDREVSVFHVEKPEDIERLMEAGIC